MRKWFILDSITNQLKVFGVSSKNLATLSKKMEVVGRMWLVPELTELKHEA